MPKPGVWRDHRRERVIAYSGAYQTADELIQLRTDKVRQGSLLVVVAPAVPAIRGESDLFLFFSGVGSYNCLYVCFQGNLYDD